MTESPSTSGRRDWRGQLTGFLLGTASGMATNLFTGATAYRAIAACITLAALLVAATGRRTLPPRAPLIRHGIRTLLCLGLVTTVGAAFGPRA